MKSIQIVIIILTMLGSFGCQAQTNKKMEENKNPLMCDPVEGICGIPDSTAKQKLAHKA